MEAMNWTVIGIWSAFFLLPFIAAMIDTKLSKIITLLEELKGKL